MRLNNEGFLQSFFNVSEQLDIVLYRIARGVPNKGVNKGVRVISKGVPNKGVRVISEVPERWQSVSLIK